MSMSRKPKLWTRVTILIASVAMVAVAACGDSTPPAAAPNPKSPSTLASTPTPASPPTPEATSTPTAAPTPVEPSSTYPYFPRLVEQNYVMEAETQGELVLENGCIRLKRVSSNDLLLIWPPRFELTVDGEDIRIRDDSGVSLSVGATIKLGGGEKKIAHLKTLVEPPIPDHCPGPYWVIGEIPLP